MEEVGQSVDIRFSNVIRRTYKQTGMRVVLIDEYDQPLMKTIGDLVLHEQMREMLRGFFGALKSLDHFLRFTFITGITKFPQVSVFSRLNQLKDISMHTTYATICGITAQEIVANFTPELQKLAEAMELSFEDTIVALAKQYNGYHFCEKSTGVYTLSA